MQPCRMSAVALLKAYRSGALSPVEAMQDVLEQVSRPNVRLESGDALEHILHCLDRRQRAAAIRFQQRDGTHSAWLHVALS